MFTRTCPPAEFDTAKSAWRHRAALAAMVMFEAAQVTAENIGTEPNTPADFARLSIEELAGIEITSVSKRPELLSDAAASVYVITGDEIRRSGAYSIPEILRLAPNLQVARVDSSQYAITARGFNSPTANKLLVLIDGRSVYTPLFSGVFWDVQDVLPENIERIEIISGPGGTLWGANAVNGVINIISRDSKDTVGGLATIGAGTVQRSASLRYGGKLGDDAGIRLSVKGFARNNTVTADGADAQDAWDKKNAGFRFDWERAGNALLLEGNVYDGSMDQKMFDDKSISGAFLLGRWNRKLSDQASLQVQAYYDRTRRLHPGTFGETLETTDLDVQHRIAFGTRHDIVWGGGYRMSRDDVTNSAALAFLPARRNLTLANIFVQDSIALSDRLQLTLGAKLEHNNYTGLEFQPNARLAWKLPNHGLFWTAISRAVRTPARLDRDLFVPGNQPFLLAGGPGFKSEKQTTYEIGYRAQPVANASFSIAGFYNVYDELRSVEPAAAGGAPFILANKMEGSTYGVETWGNARINDWWRLSAGYNYLRKDLRFQPDSRDGNVQAAGNDPAHQFSLRSTMNLQKNVELDVALRKIGTLPNPNVPGYTALDARFAWAVSKNLEISLSGFNLFDRRHLEFGAPPTRSQIGRSFYLKALWKF